MKNKKVLYIVFIVLFTIFIVPKSFQNDTFYSIPIGEEILENGIIHEDPFSEHEGLSYESPHWLFDVLTSLFYRIHGLDGVFFMVILFSCIFGIVFFLLVSDASKSDFVSFLSTILTLYLLKENFTGRAQVITYSLMILEYFLLNRLAKTGLKKYTFGLILISIVIANIHIAFIPLFFVFFLPFIAEDIMNQFTVPAMVNRDKSRAEKRLEKIRNTSGDESAMQKEIDIINKSNQYFENRVERESYKVIAENEKYIISVYVALILCFFAVLINPYGILPYTYTIKTFMGISVQFIGEHGASVVLSSKAFVVTLVIITAFLGFTDIKIKQKDAFYILGLLIYALKAYKGIPLFVFMGMLIITPMIIDFIIVHGIDLEAWDKKYFKNKIAIGMTCFALLLSCTSNFLDQYDKEYVSETMHPTKAVPYIKDNLNIENIKLFNHYNYGSYLIFNGLKPYIDSRAELYCKEFNPDCEVFQDYFDVFYHDMNLSEFQEKYKFTHYLINNTEDIFKYYLEGNDCNLIYEDENFLLYEAPNN